MDKQNLFLIGNIYGFTAQIARLVSMMNYVRHTAVSTVERLTIRELDYLYDAQSNSIGSLLLHIAAAEVGYQAVTLYNRDLNIEEKIEWDAALALGERARQTIKGKSGDYYLNKMSEVRTNTLSELARRDDQWLEEPAIFGSDQRIK